MQKRGISTIITTVIMIVLVLVAVGVVWAIVQNILTESADDISLGALKIRLNIEKVKITEAGVDVQVKRSAGEANLVGINFIISDGENTEVFEEKTTMKQLATKTFSLPYLGVVKSVEIAPVLESESGKEKIGNVVDKEEIIKEVMEIDLTIEEIIITASDLNIQVTRNIGEANLVGINFIISNGEVTETFEKETTMEEETTETFSLSYDDFVESVEIAPVFETREGEIKIGNVVDKETFTIKQILENLGAVSWWKFEGNAQDEIGGNDGEIIGDVNFVDGEYGRAASFDGGGNYISIPDSPTLHSDTQWTVMIWFKTNILSDPPVWQNIYWKGNYPDCGASIGCSGREYATWIHYTGFMHHSSTSIDRIGIGQTVCNTPSNKIEVNKLHHFVGVINSEDSKMTDYLDGELESQCAYSNTGIRDTEGNFNFGRGLKGQIDEVIIFNKALTDEQVNKLYNLDLN